MESVQTKKNCVLTSDSVFRKLRRIALQIAEQNIEEKELVIAGITGNGTVVANCLMAEISRVARFKTIPLTIKLNKKDPLEVGFDRMIDLEQKVIILVDDVANTGRTMLYALKPFLNAHPRKIQTVVLVERSHKLFPLQTDYVGLSITTTLQEHITVETEGDSITGAYLY